MWCVRAGIISVGIEFFIDNLLVRIHVIIVMMRRTGLAPWEFEFPFPGSLTSSFLSEGGIFSLRLDILSPQNSTIATM